MLGIDQRAVNGDVEDAPASLDQFGPHAEPLLDCGRQTGGLGEVASTGAVLNRDAHAVAIAGEEVKALSLVKE